LKKFCIVRSVADIFAVCALLSGLSLLDYRDQDSLIHLDP